MIRFHIEFNSPSVKHYDFDNIADLWKFCKKYDDGDYYFIMYDTDNPEISIRLYCEGYWDTFNAQDESSNSLSIYVKELIEHLNEYPHTVKEEDD
jgi:hypothetical protein